MPKRAVSVSLGSSARDKCVVAWLLGQEITLERIGTDGDTERATRLFQELDGHVDALGVGGIDLGLTVNGRYYPLHGAQKLVTGVRHTPVVDGGGLKTTLEHNLAQFIEREIGDDIQPKQMLVTAEVDRYGSALSFDEADCEILFGDLRFALGVPLPIRSLRGLHFAARLIAPFAGRLPRALLFRSLRRLHTTAPFVAALAKRLARAFLYPTGEKQEQIVPKFGGWYDWATVISGDCLYITHHMPDRLAGKVIVTNTTTAADVEAFRQRRVRSLGTSTPRSEGRSFGTNPMEAALVALAGKGRPLRTEELHDMLHQLGLQPTIQRLDR